MAIERVGGVYSFADVNIAITGPFITASLSKPGFSGEGVRIRMVSEKNIMRIGAGGAGMHTLIVSQGAKFTISLFKTGLGNALLSAAYDLQKTSAANWGQNVVTVNDIVTQDSATMQGCAFTKFPDVIYDTEGNAAMEWEFDCISAEIALGNGGGIPALTS